MHKRLLIFAVCIVIIIQHFIHREHMHTPSNHLNTHALVDTHNCNFCVHWFPNVLKNFLSASNFLEQWPLHQKLLKAHNKNDGTTSNACTQGSASETVCEKIGAKREMNRGNKIWDHGWNECGKCIFDSLLYRKMCCYFCSFFRFLAACCSSCNCNGKQMPKLNYGSAT